MKKIFLIFAILICNSAAFADMGTVVYRRAITDCEKTADARYEKISSTNDVKQNVLDTSNCYVKIANNVIRKYYADTAEDTGKKFTTFANSVYATSKNVYMGPDICYPECGQIAMTQHMEMTESVIKRYITDMLDYIDSLDI